MKKRILAILCVSALMFAALAGCNKGEGFSDDTPGGASDVGNSTGSTEGIQATPEFYAAADLSALNGKKIGITIQSLQNAYWAGVMSALEAVLKENGADYTIVVCDDSSATQIGQIENFVSSGCDLIMVHPSDAAAIEDACAQARSGGVKVMCWDAPMTNTDGNWVLNNTDLGIAIGKNAAVFINEHYSEDNKAKQLPPDHHPTGARGGHSPGPGRGRCRQVRDYFQPGRSGRHPGADCHGDHPPALSRLQGGCGYPQ